MKQIIPHKLNLGIKWSLFVSFLAFSAILLVLLWLFQIVFLDDFYRTIKRNGIINMGETLTQNIDNAELASLVERMASDEEVSVLVINNQGWRIASAELFRDSVIHRMQAPNLLRYIALARDAGGSYFEQFSRERISDIIFSPDRFVGSVPGREDNPLEVLVYARLVILADGSEALILLSAILTPVGSTVETLRAQLFFITGILLLLSLLLALLLSRRIARPIIQINDKSRELARGHYNVHFEASGYREAAELADTLNLAAADLNQVESVRRELVANVSHDLRTPLTMIRGYAEVIRDLPGENTPENIQVIIDETTRLASLVNDLLDLSKIQAGSQPLSVTTFNLTGAIRRVLVRLGKLVELEGYCISFEAEDDIQVQADAARIDQVLYNLVINAVHFTGSDKQVIVIQKLIPEKVRIEVHDRGEGILPEQLPHIWERYYKGGQHHRRPIVGTGLGLSIVRSILEQHQAAFGVDSQPGQGSVFWFELPQIIS